MYLPDSNVVIRAFQGYEPEASLLKRHIMKGSIKISVIVVAEFLVKATDEQTERFNNLLKEFGSLLIEEEAAIIAAEYRKQFLGKSKRVFLLDCFLAAQAKLKNFILVTNNRSDFPMKDIQIVRPSA